MTMIFCYSRLLLQQQQQRAVQTTTQASLIRLNKLLASKGWGSRREVDQYINNGWIQVDGQIITTLGTKVHPDDYTKIEFTKDGIQQANSNYNNLLIKKRKTSVILNKPLGIVSCQPQRSDQKPAIQLLTAKNRYFLKNEQERHHQLRKNNNYRHHNPYIEPYRLPKLAVSGRLDINTTGLLLFTQDGVIARTIIGPDSTIEKEYLVRIHTSTADGCSSHSHNTMRFHRNNHNQTNEPIIKINSLNESDSFIQEILERLRMGIMDDNDFLTAKTVCIQNENQLKFILTSGKYHHIRRMCEAVHLPIASIKRVRIGNICLGSLPLGKWRYLQPHEIIF